MSARRRAPQLKCEDCSRSLTDETSCGQYAKGCYLTLCASCQQLRQGEQRRAKCPGCRRWKSFNAKLCGECYTQARQVGRRRDSGEAMRHIAEVTARVPEDIRDDVRQLLCLDALDGTLDRVSVDARATEHAKAMRRAMRPNPYVVSLDASVPGDEGLTLAEVIVDERIGPEFDSLAEWWERSRPAHWPFYSRSIPVRVVKLCPE